MRKRLITPTSEPLGTQGGLDLEREAVVEVTSEDEHFPVESAFGSGDARGWRAAAHLKRLFASSGISVHPSRHVKWNSIKWTCTTLMYSNWLSSRTSLAGSLALR